MGTYSYLRGTSFARSSSAAVDGRLLILHVRRAARWRFIVDILRGVNNPSRLKALGLGHRSDDFREARPGGLEQGLNVRYPGFGEPCCRVGSDNRYSLKGRPRPWL